MINYFRSFLLTSVKCFSFVLTKWFICHLFASYVLSNLHQYEFVFLCTTKNIAKSSAYRLPWTEKYNIWILTCFSCHQSFSIEDGRIIEVLSKSHCRFESHFIKMMLLSLYIIFKTSGHSVWKTVVHELLRTVSTLSAAISSWSLSMTIFPHDSYDISESFQKTGTRII